MDDFTLADVNGARECCKDAGDHGACAGRVGAGFAQRHGDTDKQQRR